MIYLASRSPRRREILARMGVNFQPVDVEIDESVHDREAPKTYVARVALEKAAAGAASAAGLVLGSDTTVSIDDEVLGKPATPSEARSMLERLSDRTHDVFTAVAVIADGDQEVLVAHSEVRFAPLEDAWLDRYLASDEPYDKAGGYGIQGYAATRITHLSGSYSAVMGLPVYETTVLLERHGMVISP